MKGLVPTEKYFLKFHNWLLSLVVDLVVDSRDHCTDISVTNRSDRLFINLDAASADIEFQEAHAMPSNLNRFVVSPQTPRFPVKTGFLKFGPSLYQL